MSITEAKNALDKIIRKSRIHLYKPIQIAEILYHHRIDQNFDLNDLESYRNPSKKWRNNVSTILVGRICTSSAKFQDNIFEENAMPPRLLAELGRENVSTQGIVEAYIYSAFIEKYREIRIAKEFVKNATPADFDVTRFMGIFSNSEGLRRSIDKVYEIVVYALFSTLIRVMEPTVCISVGEDKLFMVEEFDSFIHLVLGLDTESLVCHETASIYRVGVTNAADRGLDMWGNFGPAIQVKHQALTWRLVSDVAEEIEADRIVLVCRDGDVAEIRSELDQNGWENRVQIVTETRLKEWYDRALRGPHAALYSNLVLRTIEEQLETEFPAVVNADFFRSRGYHRLYPSGIWSSSDGP